MTKLADAIRRSQRVEAAPMGFGASRPAPKPSMVVGAIAGAAEPLAAYKDAGTEVVIVDGRGKVPGEADAKKLGAEADGLVLGLLAGTVDATQARYLKEAGFDFLIFDADATAAAALLDDDLGYVLSLPWQPEESFLRSLESLSLDAVYLESLPAPLTVTRQLELGRIALFSHKPLVCLVPAATSAEDLRCLRAAGAGVVLATGAEAARALREAVSSLPPRKARRDEGRMVSLPRGAAQPDLDDDDEDDD